MGLTDIAIAASASEPTPSIRVLAPGEDQTAA
jgi:hypothetical protein